MKISQRNFVINTQLFVEYSHIHNILLLFFQTDDRNFLEQIEVGPRCCLTLPATNNHSQGKNDGNVDNANDDADLQGDDHEAGDIGTTSCGIVQQHQNNDMEIQRVPAVNLIEQDDSDDSQNSDPSNNRSDDEIDAENYNRDTTSHFEPMMIADNDGIAHHIASNRDNADSRCDDASDIHYNDDHGVSSDHLRTTETYEVTTVVSEERAVTITAPTAGEDQCGIGISNRNDHLLMNDEDDFDIDEEVDREIINDVHNHSYVNEANDGDDSNDEARVEDVDDVGKNDIVNVTDDDDDMDEEEDGRKSVDDPGNEIPIELNNDLNLGDDEHREEDLATDAMNNENAIDTAENRGEDVNINHDDQSAATSISGTRQLWNQGGRYRVEILPNTGVFIDKRVLKKIRSKYAKKPRSMERALFINIVGEKCLKRMTRTGRHQKGNVREKFPEDVFVAVRGVYELFDNVIYI